MLLRLRFMPLRRHLESIREEVAAAGIDRGRRVSLGLPPSIRVLLARRVVEQFCDAHPTVTVRLTEETSGEVRDLVALGQLDLAITNALEPIAGLATQPLATEPMVVVGPSSAGLDPSTTVGFSRSRFLATDLDARAEQSAATRRKRPRPSRHQAEHPARGERAAADDRSGGARRGLHSASLVRSHAGCAGGTCVGGKLEGVSISWVITRSRDRSLTPAGRALLDIITEEARASMTDGTWLWGRP